MNLSYVECCRNISSIMISVKYVLYDLRVSPTIKPVLLYLLPFPIINLGPEGFIFYFLFGSDICCDEGSRTQ